MLASVHARALPLAAFSGVKGKAFEFLRGGLVDMVDHCANFDGNSFSSISFAQLCLEVRLRARFFLAYFA